MLIDRKLQPPVHLVLQEAPANVEVKGMISMLDVD